MAQLFCKTEQHPLYFHFIMILPVSISEPRSPAESGTYFVKILCAGACLYVMLQCVHVTLLKCLQSLLVFCCT